MAFTLHSSISSISFKDIKTPKTLDDFSAGTVCFPQTIKPTRSRRLSAKISRQVAHSTPFEAGTYDEIDEEVREKLHGLSSTVRSENDDSTVPVYVMLPLDTVSLGGHLNKAKAMNVSLMALKSAGVEGVMVDVWWGLVDMYI
ncbi:hypothetical protein SSX86_020637 [Deinandra increscens subsp. villosa]|uniref:Beta-amylase n=1 Tax=Deinandra increscens subsp. villosa TaxID=3103831 RepID=A0AAP0CV51_9ASTR